MLVLYLFFFNDTATTEIYTLSLHDALPISPGATACRRSCPTPTSGNRRWPWTVADSANSGSRRCRSFAASSCRDRKSTRLNSSHANISYAVFCLKKKKKQHTTQLDGRKNSN